MTKIFFKIRFKLQTRHDLETLRTQKTAKIRETDFRLKTTTLILDSEEKRESFIEITIEIVRIVMIVAV